MMIAAIVTIVAVLGILCFAILCFAPEIARWMSK